MSEGICSGFEEHMIIEGFCPHCQEITNIMVACYYDLAKCMVCGELLESE